MKSEKFPLHLNTIWNTSFWLNPKVLNNFFIKKNFFELNFSAQIPDKIKCFFSRNTVQKFSSDCTSHEMFTFEFSIK